MAIRGPLGRVSSLLPPFNSNHLTGQPAPLPIYHGILARHRTATQPPTRWYVEFLQKVPAIPRSCQVRGLTSEDNFKYNISRNMYLQVNGWGGETSLGQCKWPKGHLT